MDILGLSLKNSSKNQVGLQVSIQASKKPGGQTAQSVFGKNQVSTSISAKNLMEFSTTTLSEGFVLDGFFLGTFEFDSLTGHPGIRY
ncbi:hypothetical protein [Rufibacter hautae]|uniref:Uncharacterized protein n=1 Tax=Rufibacter hautae TaxID=2595005 RepID=A0A5B6TCR5_9BACT|nr:hypothetical protein [Rufibacter hautae]KAA3437956.1 hypothetical protein FOA19_11790 [Rufibacter hautae]